MTTTHTPSFRGGLEVCYSFFKFAPVDSILTVLLHKVHESQVCFLFVLIETIDASVIGRSSFSVNRYDRVSALTIVYYLIGCPI